MTKTIMLIHGAWLNADSWEGFKARYEARGYTVIAPSWPFDEPTPPPSTRPISSSTAATMSPRVVGDGFS